ncbi:hypothetical protein [Larkinella soli]|nr:hypothetical protein [Larkinella soli]
MGDPVERTPLVLLDLRTIQSNRRLVAYYEQQMQYTTWLTSNSSPTASSN